MNTIPDPSFLRCFQNHRLSINWLAFSPNGNYIATASDDRNAILWSLEEKSNVCYKYTGHSDSVTSIAVADTFMISASKDCTARLWRLDRIDGLNYSTDSCLYRCHQSPVRSVDINFDETQFCTSSDDKTVKIWSTTATNKLIATLSGEHTNWIRHARFSRLSPHLLSSCGDDGTICIWDQRKKEAAIKLTSKRRSTHFLSVQWHPNCEYIMSSSSSDYLIRLWDLRYEKTIQCYQVHDGFVSSTDFHSSGKYLISSSLDQACKILDLYEGRTLFTIKAHSGQVNCAQFSPSGDCFATAGQDHVVLYWKSNLDCYNGDSTDDEDIRSISFDPDTPPLNNFDSDDIKSIRKQFSDVKIKDSESFNGKSSKSHASRSTNKDSSTLNSSSPKDSFSLDSSSISILKCILQQLEIITDSILNIDQRLITLEDKFDKLKAD